MSGANDVRIFRFFGTIIRQSPSAGRGSERSETGSALLIDARTWLRL